MLQTGHWLELEVCWRSHPALCSNSRVRSYIRMREYNEIHYQFGSRAHPDSTELRGCISPLNAAVHYARHEKYACCTDTQYQ